MRRLIIILSAFFTLNLCAAEKVSASSDSLLVTQEIRYLSPEATKVYLVWGLNNWNLPHDSLLKDGSFIKNNLVYTPMKQQSYGFTASLDVPVNTMVDYIFWITQGPAEKPVDVWDLNKAPLKDYHSLVINNNIALITPTVNVRSKEALSILDFAIPISSISTLALLLVITFTRFPKKISIDPGPVKIIVSTGFVLAFNLVLLRSSVTGLSWDFYLHPIAFLSQITWSAFYDVFYVLALTGFFLLLLKLFKTRGKISTFFQWLYISISFLSLLIGILNIKIVETIGKPFDYGWFYYSDFLRSADSHAAVSSNLSKEYLMQVLMICLSAIFSGIVVIMLSDIFLRRLRFKRTLSFSLAACSILYIIVAPSSIRKYNLNYEKLSNPIVAFGSSLNPLSGEPELFTMKIADSLKFDLFFKKNQEVVLKRNPAIKNVLILVMESTPAEYIQPYSTSYKITPELEKYLPQSIVFENIYAHAPSTNNSMVSILGSIYPWISYNCLTKEHPDINIPTISSELNKYGYRTAFFNSADNRFQKADEFLANRKFDEIKDCNSTTCKAHFEFNDKGWSFMGGKDDECTANDLTCWAKEKSDKPFFAMMWTYQTHYPYFTSGEEIQYDSSDPVFNRYLNALHHTDYVLGKILAELKENGLSESTLVVVVGDHGEAFGRHNQVVHASGIYEENLHVPCIFINPAFNGEHRSEVGGLVDLAPTIMSQLGYPAAEKWQGNNLFTKKESDRVYFFTPWADYLFGYREGNKKYIFNATKNLTELYDLKNDPLETRNLAVHFPERVNISHQRIAGWVQSLNQYRNILFAQKKDK
jgi:lipoteichoic acid synthase